MEIVEGQVKLSVPPQKRSPKAAEAYYTTKMSLNRDLSVALARVLDLKRIAEPFGATGVRGLRYAKEVPDSKVLIGDWSEGAVNLIKSNVELNDLENVEVVQGDARDVLRGREFDLVDLDPFGSPAPFIEAGLNATKKGGVLAVTATDMRPLCGVSPKGEMPKYGGAKSLKTEFCHEVGVRLLLGFIARKSHIRPLISLSDQHYMRVFVTKGGLGAKGLGGMEGGLGYLYHCGECLKRKTLKTKKKSVCCGKEMGWAGPLWLGEIHNKTLLESVKNEVEQGDYENKKRLLKVLELMIRECGMPPFYYDLPTICKRLTKSVPSMRDVLGTLRFKGFRVARTHFKPTAFKSDASLAEVKKILSQ